MTSCLFIQEVKSRYLKTVSGIIFVIITAKNKLSLSDRQENSIFN